MDKDSDLVKTPGKVRRDQECIYVQNQVGKL